MSQSDFHVRVPPHGYVELTDVEKEILDSHYVQRLRHITQLGATHLVYPDATHKRFGHSLGVLYVADQLASTLDIDQTTHQAIRLAALLHDTGHGPWSHTSESIAEQFGRSHEDYSCDVIDDLSHMLPVDTDLVKDHVRGNGEPNVVAGVFDADRMDYLIRDSIYTGVTHGTIDIDTLLEFAVEIDENVGIEEKGVPAMNQLLSARLQMYQAVYSHDTVRYFDALLKRALHQYAVDHGIDQLMTSTEQDIHHQLMEFDAYERYYTREKYPQLIDIPASDLTEDECEYIIENGTYAVSKQLAEHLDVDLNKVYVQKPMIVGETFGEVPILESSGTVSQLYDVSTLPQRLSNEYKNTTSFAVYGSIELKSKLENNIIQLIM